MLDKKTILKVSRIKGILNQDNASKDYFQEILLLAISREYPELVFKGGTCLCKFHGLDRFSEDIDLNGRFNDDGPEKLGEYLKDFGYVNTVRTRKMRTGYLSEFKIRGFLYNGEDVSMTRVRLDVSTKDRTTLPPISSTYRPLYPDIPSFTIFTMDTSEVLSEKVRTLFQRSKSRDLYDLDFLIQKGTPVDTGLIMSKMKVNDIVPEDASLIGSLVKIERKWKLELGPVLGRIPPFQEIKERVLRKMREAELIQ